jgi:hypothetical protein
VKDWAALEVAVLDLGSNVRPSELRLLRAAAAGLSECINIRDKLADIIADGSAESEDYDRLKHRCDTMIDCSCISNGIAAFKSLRKEYAEDEMLEKNGVFKPSWFWQAVELLTGDVTTDTKEQLEEVTTYGEKISQRLKELGSTELAAKVDQAIFPARDFIENQGKDREEWHRLSKNEMPVGESYDQLKHHCKDIIANFDVDGTRKKWEKVMEMLRVVGAKLDMLS